MRYGSETADKIDNGDDIEEINLNSPIKQIQPQKMPTPQPQAVLEYTNQTKSP